MKYLSIQQLNQSIIEYRRAFWAHRYPNQPHMQPLLKEECAGGRYFVGLVDSWVETKEPGRHLIKQAEVKGSSFSAPSRQEALDLLAGFVRHSFVDDAAFKKI